MKFALTLEFCDYCPIQDNLNLFVINAIEQNQSFRVSEKLVILFCHTNNTICDICDLNEQIYRY